MNNFKKLFEPIHINSLELSNRIIMPAMCTEYANSDGSVTQRMIDYYTTRAAGGAGLVITEITYLDSFSKGFPHMFGIYDDHLIPGLKKLTKSIHDVDGRIAVQLAHMGRRTFSNLINSIPVAPSPIAAIGLEVPRELSVSEIKGIVEEFGQAARRTVEAGFDAIEIHMAHGYLINQFLSPYSNKRTDEYGQTIEGRARFAVEIVRRIRQEVGPKFPILCKINASEFVPEGITLDMCKANVRLLEEAGIDAVTVSGGILETGEYITQPMSIPRGCHVERARAIKQVAKIPVIAVGRINDPLLAEEILQKGDADLIAMGRSLIADPELPLKAREQRLEDIRPCIACNQGCVDRLYKNLDIACLTNPVAGREGQINLTVCAAPKKVMVVGGGPAGLTAASTAAKRGHKVTLYEASEVLGGQLVLAGVPPFKSEIGRFTRFLEHDARRSGVDIVTGHKVSAEDLEDIRPEVVVMATGSDPETIKIPGIERCISAESCLSGEIKISGPCVIIGGGSVGCETAHVLAEQGIQVTVLKRTEPFAPDLGGRPRKLLLQRLLELGVDLLAQAKVTEIGDDYIEFERHGLTEKLTEINEVVIAVGYRPNSQDELVKTCETMGVQVYTIGDCKQVRRAIEAVREGFDCALAI